MRAPHHQDPLKLTDERALSVELALYKISFIHDSIRIGEFACKLPETVISFFFKMNECHMMKGQIGWRSEGAGFWADKRALHDEQFPKYVFAVSIIWAPGIAGWIFSFLFLIHFLGGWGLLYLFRDTRNLCTHPHIYFLTRLTSSSLPLCNY